MEIRNESSSERIIMESPDELAADYIEGFEVTSDMPENYSSAITQQSNRNSTRNENSCHLRFTPKKLTQKITVKIRIKGMITGMQSPQFSNFPKRYVLRFIPQMPLNH